MNYFLIGYIISVIITIALCVIVYKNNSKDWIKPPTIETFVKDFWIFLIISFIPGINDVFILFFSIYIIWNRIKDIKL